MKISLNWLKDFISIDIPVEQVSEILTDIGLEVEKVSEIESVPGGLNGLVIGEVLSTEKHPDADRLKVTSVNVGQEEPFQIVCGAPNVAAGQKVVVALPGTTIFPTTGEPFKIKQSKIRGVESNGMICAEDEIGLGSDHDGIMVLDPSALVGLTAAKYFGVESDIQIEIGLTPNRADAMSHYGVARDLMAAFKHKGILSKDSQICRHSIDSFKEDNHDLTIDVIVENKEDCPRYAGVTLTDVKVQDSPKWLKDRLNTIGVRPINNVVDVTNYVLHELGQPLHAFDAEIVGKKVLVGNVLDNTKFITLDETERSLNSNDLMIKNEQGGMCIAGVFGGLGSGVTANTTKIFLESAYFNPVSVRKTAKRHGLSTDASFRFERGIDPNITVHALKRAALLLKEIAGAKISSELIDIQSSIIEDFEFEVNLERINRLLGISIPKTQVLDILESLSISATQTDENKYLLKVPAYRVDVQREVDIAEEILRIYGFNNIPLPEKLNSSITLRDKIDKEKVQNLVSDLLVSKGMVEAMSNSLTKSSYTSIIDSKSIKPEFEVRMLNPLSSDLDVLRQTLMFGTLEAVRLNQNNGNEDVRLFEFGKIYQKFESGYNERKFLALVLVGKREPESWTGSNDKVSFFTLKSIVQSIFEKLGLLKNYNYQASKNEFFSDGLTLTISKRKVADFGWINAKMKKHFDIKQDVFYAEIDWETVIELLSMNKVKFKEINKYPYVLRDLSLLIDNATNFSDLESIAFQTERKLLKEVSLFDVYEGKNLPEGKKSYAIRFKLHDETKTLQDKEIDSVMTKLQTAYEVQLKAQLR
ncbi:MAG: phenylalanine--tRNA ligase subunit beta [Flavobacteriales bacterium]|nr:phenylalanine--tRNA ligase subunit beta [Flavobacteriales bacterium]